MKKTDIALILGVVIIIVIGIFVMKGSKPEPTYTLPLEMTGEAGLKELSYKEYQEKIDNNESFVVIVERKTCSHCANFMPVAEEFANKYKVPMYYIDTDTFEEEDWNNLSSSNTFFKKHGDSWGTPTTIVLAGNTAVDFVEGETTEDTLLELYKKYFDYEEEGE